MESLHVIRATSRHLALLNQQLLSPYNNYTVPSSGQSFLSTIARHPVAAHHANLPGLPIINHQRSARNILCQFHRRTWALTVCASFTGLWPKQFEPFSLNFGPNSLCFTGFCPKQLVQVSLDFGPNSLCQFHWTLSQTVRANFTGLWPLKQSDPH